MDELGGVGLRGELGDDGEEGVALGVAGGAETGLDLVEAAIVIAGVTAEFEDSIGRQGSERFGEGEGVEVAGGGDAERAVSSEDVRVADLRDAVEARLQGVEGA